MTKRKEIEILISEDGETMEVTAHNFKGKGCEALVNAFRFGQVTESGPTPEYYQQENQTKPVTQGQ
jgi:Protein of unknown function (DUF2997)